MAKILGSTTTYHGTEHPYLRGCKVRIVAVMKRAAAPDYDPDRTIRTCATRRRSPARAASPPTTAWRFSHGSKGSSAGASSTSDPRAIDLACFRELTKSELKPTRWRGEPAPAQPPKETK